MLQDIAQREFGEADVAVLIERHVPEDRQLLGIEANGDALGDYGHTMPPPERKPLDDGAGQDGDNLVERNFVSQFLGNERERRARSHTHAEREMSRGPAHGDHEIPAPRGLRVLHKVFNELGAELARGLEPEGRDPVRQRQIVVDRLRHVAHRDCTRGLLLHARRGVGGIVAADGHQVLDAEAGQRLDDIGHLFVTFRRVLARRPDDGPAACMDARYVLGMKRENVRGVAFREPLKAIADADHFKPLLPGLKGDRADHAVDPWGGSSAYDHRKFLCHSCLLLHKIIRKQDVSRRAPRKLYQNTACLSILLNVQCPEERINNFRVDTSHPKRYYFHRICPQNIFREKGRENEQLFDQ